MRQGEQSGALHARLTDETQELSDLLQVSDQPRTGLRGWTFRDHKQLPPLHLMLPPESGLPVTTQGHRGEGNRRRAERAQKWDLFYAVPACMPPGMGSSLPPRQLMLPSMGKL